MSMRLSLVHIRNWVCLLSVLVYLLHVMFPWGGLGVLVPYASLASLVLTWPAASNFAKVLSLAFLCIGTVLLYTGGHLHWSSFLGSFGSMLNLLSLFSIVPILALPILVGNYQRSVEQFLSRRNPSPTRLYMMINALSYLLASLMNIAAIPMMYQSVAKYVQSRSMRNPGRFLITSIVTGYAMPLSWSPVAAVVVAVIHVTGVQWLSVLPITLGLSFVGLLMAALLSGANRSPIDRPTKVPEEAGAEDQVAASFSTSEHDQKVRNLWEIGLAILVFVFLTQVVQMLTGWDMIEAIAVLSIPFSWAWSALAGGTSQFWALLRQHGRSIQTLQNTFSVFTSAGFLIRCLSNSPYLSQIHESFVHVSWALGPPSFLAIVPWIIVVLSLIGLHPVVAIALLGSSLNPSLLHVSPFWLAITLFGAGIVTFIVSPFNATVNVMSAVSQIEPVTIIRWNLLFSMLFLGFVTALAAAGQALTSI